MNYQEMCSFETLYKAYLTARKGKRSKDKTAHYEAHALACTEKLSYTLNGKQYRPSEFEVFKVYEPKERLVQAPAFVDKVVLHAVVDNILYEAITNSFIRDNFASQNGKGTHDGLMRLKHHMVKYYAKTGSADGWVLKADVRHFFASIDHDILKEKLLDLCVKRKVDTEVYDLMCIYIDTTEGLPLGYQTSQLLALLFLDEYDHFVKEKLGCKFYGRYMDDFYIIAQDKNELRKILEATREWMGGIKLELNEKTAIFPLKNGIDFLGFHTYLTESGQVVQKLRRDGVKRIRKRVENWKRDVPAGNISKEEVIDRFRAWDAFAAHGDTYALRLKYAGKVSEIVGEEIKPRRQINSTLLARERRRLKQYKNICKKRGDYPVRAPVLRDPSHDDTPPWM